MQGRPGRKKIRDDEAIIEMFKQGHSRRYIREYFNLSSTVVNSVIHRFVIDNPDEVAKIVSIPDIKVIEPWRKYKLDAGKIKALYNAYWSITEIAKEFMTEPSVIEEFMRKEGIL